MRTLVPTLMRAGGLRRSCTVVAATAVATAVLMAAGGLLMLWFDGVERGWIEMGDDTFMQAPADDVNFIVADPSTRIGVLFGAVVLVLPPLMLLDQAVRLGTTTRARRDAALRIAGATRRDVRRLAAVEVALPALVGAVVGVPVFLVLRAVLSATGFLPAGAFPPIWLLLAIFALVALVGALVGARSGTADPLATTRRTASTSSLLPWGPVTLVLGVVTLSISFLGYGHGIADVAIFVALGLVILGLVGCAPWVAFFVARRAARRATTAVELIAAQRVFAAPGTAGRAAAGIAAVGLTLGATAVFTADILSMGYWSGETYDDGALATIVAALLALVVLAGSLAVHAVETLWESRRELAYLAGTGTPQSVLDDALLLQVRLVAVPLGVAGATLGGGGYALLSAWSSPTILLAAGVGILATWASVRAAAWAATRSVRPFAREASSPAHLRTE